MNKNSRVKQFIYFLCIFIPWIIGLFYLGRYLDLGPRPLTLWNISTTLLAVFLIYALKRAYRRWRERKPQHG